MSTFSYRSLIMATGGTVNEIFTRDDPDLDGFRINYTKYLGRFECPWEKWKTPSIYDLLEWKFLKKDNSNIPEKEVSNITLPFLMPLQQTNFEDIVVKS